MLGGNLARFKASVAHPCRWRLLPCADPGRPASADQSDRRGLLCATLRLSTPTDGVEDGKQPARDGVDGDELGLEQQTGC